MGNHEFPCDVCGADQFAGHREDSHTKKEISARMFRIQTEWAEGDRKRILLANLRELRKKARTK